MSITITELHDLHGKPVVVTSPTLRVAGQLLDYAERGGLMWLDLGNGQAISITHDMEIQGTVIDGTFDFTLTPQEKFPFIYAAYDHYGGGAGRKRQVCGCGRCGPIAQPTGRGDNDIPIDDLGLSTMPPTIVGNG